jgi:hypothetical protein
VICALLHALRSIRGFPATLSSRFTTPLFWREPESGIGYQVQLEIPQSRMDSITQIEQVPVRASDGCDILVQDVAQVRQGTMPGQVDRYNMKRMVSLTANVEGEDLARVAKHIDAALLAVNKSLWAPATGPDGQPGWKHEITKEFVYQKELRRPPRRFAIDVRGQVFPLRQMFGGLAGGKIYEGLGPVQARQPNP